MLALENVSKTYTGVAVVDGVNIAAEAGEFLALIGESGSGKSTTLKMINRLIEPTAGVVRLDGRDVTQAPAAQLRRSIGYAFQQIGLFPHLSVADNVAVTPSLLGWPRTEVEARVEELLALVKLPAADYAARMPHELSGGQQQRVGFARALAARPRLLLLDEPFGALDPMLRDELQDDLRALHDRLGLTTILVSHDMTEALCLADRVLVMRNGRLLQDAAPAVVAAYPADDYVARLVEAPRRQAAAFERLMQAGEGP